MCSRRRRSATCPRRWRQGCSRSSGNRRRQRRWCRELVVLGAITTRPAPWLVVSKCPRGTRTRMDPLLCATALSSCLRRSASSCAWSPRGHSGCRVVDGADRVEMREAGDVVEVQRIGGVVGPGDVRVRPVRRLAAGSTTRRCSGCPPGRDLPPGRRRARSRPTRDRRAIPSPGRSRTGSRSAAGRGCVSARAKTSSASLRQVAACAGSVTGRAGSRGRNPRRAGQRGWG